MDMNGKKMVEVYEGISIPVPLGLTPEQEAEVIARFKAEYPPEQIAAEEAEVRGMLDGTIPTVSMEQLLKELEMEYPPQQGGR